MRIALIADTYPPLRSSGAVQLRDIACEFARQKHAITVFVASAQQIEPWRVEHVDGVQVLRLRTPKTKDVGRVRRTLAELLMPFYMGVNYKLSPFSESHWDAVIWYSPSIFLGPIVQFLKRRSNCSSYLIIRDIFPDWAVDIGLMSKGLLYFSFKIVANYQYSVANVIGVQTSGNCSYFKKWSNKGRGRLEVLQNWIADSPRGYCSIQISETSLAGRKIFVYAGNMGVAQGMNKILDLVHAMIPRLDVGFVFVGRGSDYQRLRAETSRRKLDNVLFFDEIDPVEITSLYSQCDVGMVALDSRHKTHNIPGKFISYMQSGLPVMAMINPGNDLEQLIISYDLGIVTTCENPVTLHERAVSLLSKLERDKGFPTRCRKLYLKLFTPEIAVKQIIQALQV